MIVQIWFVEKVQFLKNEPCQFKKQIWHKQMDFDTKNDICYNGQKSFSA